MNLQAHRAALMALISLASVQPYAQVFKAGTELVSIPVTITDRAGNPIHELKAADFRVFEDGVEQQVTLLDRERRPLSICVVLDSSTSMRNPIQTHARVVVETLLAGLLPDDEVSLVVFAQEIQVPMQWVSGGKRPRVNWSTYTLANGTVLHDAMLRGIGLLDSAQNTRTAILVVSDGADTMSRATISQVAKTRRQSEAVIYGAHAMEPVARPQSFPRDPLSDGPPSQPPMARRPFTTTADLLGPLVGDSGGIVYRVNSTAAARTAAESFLDELRHVYTLGYSSSKPMDGKFRRVKVDPRDQRLRVRHRTGYLALPVESPK